MLTGVILAGGKNKRMGGVHKSLLPYFGEPLIQRQIRTMRHICDEIIVVTNEPRPFLYVLKDSVRIITDYYPGRGPLSGMHASFKLTTNPYLWVVSCDNPNISREAAEAMLTELQNSDKEVIIPFIEGKLLLLHALYKSTSVEVIEQLVQQHQCHINELLSFVNWKQLPESFFADKNIQPDFCSDLNSFKDFLGSQHIESIDLQQTTA